MNWLNMVVVGALALVVVLQCVQLWRSRATPWTELEHILLRQEGQAQALAQQLQAVVHTLGQNQQLHADGLRQLVEAHLAQALQEARASRQELQQHLATVQQALAEQAHRHRSSSEQQADQLRTSLHERLSAIQKDNASQLEALRRTVEEQLHRHQHSSEQQAEQLRTTLNERLGAIQKDNATQLEGLRRTVDEQLHRHQHSGEQQAEQLRITLNERLAAIQQDNAAKLEDMRRTVDEQLHATLEQRLGASFALVSDRLEQVHKGLGEMQTLAASVGDLKRVMTNVKTRGTWGEAQLGAILDSVLTPEQYGRNVKTVPDSNELVEFAIRLPGQGEQPVWLPIDAKYPVEDYQRLQDAWEQGDRLAIQAAAQALESSVRAEAKKIASKYLAPPHTTDFALMYLPSESLFAEVLRRPGLVEALQQQYRVVVTGPANLAAMLNSLQMGFRTLAIEERSAQVWVVLGQVKTEFTKFGAVVEATRKSLDAAAKKFEQVDVRTRAIQRSLKGVQSLPSPEQGSDAAALRLELGAQGHQDEEA